MKELKTKRLRIVPLTDEQLKEQIGQEQDAHMRKAMQEMLDGCTAHPGERIWYTLWRIYLRENGRVIGSIGFRGLPQDGGVEIGYGIDETYRNQGYAGEAAGAAVNWAFSQNEVYFVTAEAEPENTASRRILEKLGFTECGAGAEGLRFEKEKPETSFTSLYMSLYIGVGLCMGVAFGQIGIGLCIGVAVGLSLGVALDAQDKKKREKYRKLRKNANKGDEGAKNTGRME